MKQISDSDKYCLMSSMTLNKKYFVVAIKKMLTAADFVTIAKDVHRSPRAKIKFRFVAPPKEKFTPVKKLINPKPEQIQLTF